MGEGIRYVEYRQHFSIVWLFSALFSVPSKMPGIYLRVIQKYLMLHGLIMSRGQRPHEVESVLGLRAPELSPSGSCCSDSSPSI